MQHEEWSCDHSQVSDPNRDFLVPVRAFSGGRLNWCKSGKHRRSLRDSDIEMTLGWCLEIHPRELNVAAIIASYNSHSDTNIERVRTHWEIFRIKSM